MSQNQNPPLVSQSQSQQTGSEADVKPFSISQYVLASRHRNIIHNWPFHEKHLQLCFKHGIMEVLPPFGRQTSLVEPLKGCSNLMHSQNDNNKDADSCKPEVPHLIDDESQSIKNECDNKVTNHSSSNKEGNQHNCSMSAKLSQPADTFTLLRSNYVHKSNSVLSSSKAGKDKRRRRKGRCKKRSMTDILAVARHSTLEEIHSMNKFFYAETVIARCQQTMPYENFSKSQIASEDSCRKAGSEDHGVANVDVAAKGSSLLLKFKLNLLNRNCGT